MKHSEERWVNIGKCIAIFAVMTDHLRGSLYSSEGLQHASFFSVTLFILLMGATTYWSFDTTTYPVWEKITKRFKAIIIPYIVATFVFHCLSSRGFYWSGFWDSLVHFNASGPHYYVLVYVQLLIISPVLFYLIKVFDRLGRFKGSGIKLLFGWVLRAYPF